MAMVAINTKCPMCGVEHIVMVPEDGIRKYNDGALIQDAFPMLTDDEREMLKTGIDHDCWDKLFGDEE